MHCLTDGAGSLTEELSSINHCIAWFLTFFVSDLYEDVGSLIGFKLSVIYRAPQVRSLPKLQVHSYHASVRCHPYGSYTISICPLSSLPRPFTTVSCPTMHCQVPGILQQYHGCHSTPTICRMSFNVVDHSQNIVRKTEKEKPIQYIMHTQHLRPGVACS